MFLLLLERGEQPLLAFTWMAEVVFHEADSPDLNSMRNQISPTWTKSEITGTCL